MTAEITNGPVPCGKCGKDIPAFAVLYRVTPARLVRCKDCAAPMVEQLPSVELETTVVPVKVPVKVSYEVQNFDRFNRPRTADTVRGNIHDWRAKQSGERE